MSIMRAPHKGETVRIGDVLSSGFKIHDIQTKAMVLEIPTYADREKLVAGNTLELKGSAFKIKSVGKQFVVIEPAVGTNYKKA